MTAQLSVVVPTYGRPDLLRKCLQALLQQDLPAEAYEVIVADNAGSDRTRRLVEELSRASPPVRYLRAAEKPGPAAARNAGWRFARGDFIAFTDDDCLPQPMWLREGWKALREGYDCVTGRVLVPLPSRPTDYEKNTARLATAEFLTANCFFRRRTLVATAGFDERFETAWREDSDLQFTMLESSCKIGTAVRAVVVHPVRRAPWGVSLREQRKSLYNALLYRKHPELYRRRIQPGPPWRHYAIVLSALAAVAAAVAGQGKSALVISLAWGVLTASFAFERLQGTTRRPGHLAEMLITSILIPPLSVFWRLYGAVKYRVWFC